MNLDIVKAYLTEVNNGTATIDEAIVEEFGETCKNLLREVFNSRPRDFTIRMSNIGRPLCQLQMEKAGEPREPFDYNHPTKMMIGHLIEALAVATMKAAGIKIETAQEKVSIPINDTEIHGTLDVTIDGGVYDIKSCSPFAFEFKFNNPNGFQRLLEDDPFGYIAQGYLYGASKDLPFKGWIAINKSTGEWAVLETPYSQTGYKKQAVKKAEDTVLALANETEFKRCFTPQDEVFNKKATGNKVLGITCSYCPWKLKCWEGEELNYAVNPRSKGKYPQRKWYLGEIK